MTMGVLQSSSGGATREEAEFQPKNAIRLDQVIIHFSWCMCRAIFYLLDCLVHIWHGYIYGYDFAHLTCVTSDEEQFSQQGTISMIG